MVRSMPTPTHTTNPHCGQHCYFVTFDVSNAESFNLAPKLFEEIERYSRPYTTVFLVGNKSDLTQERVISKEQAEVLLKFLFLFLLCSFFSLSVETCEGERSYLLGGFCEDWRKYEKLT